MSHVQMAFDLPPEPSYTLRPGRKIAQTTGSTLIEELIRRKVLEYLSTAWVDFSVCGCELDLDYTIIEAQAVDRGWISLPE